MTVSFYQSLYVIAKAESLKQSPCNLENAQRRHAAAAFASELLVELSLLALLSADGAAALSLDSFLPAGNTLLFLPRESVT